jgi:hypothetical protein
MFQECDNGLSYDETELHYRNEERIKFRIRFCPFVQKHWSSCNLPLSTVNITV